MPPLEINPALDVPRCLERVRQRDPLAARELVAHVRPILLRTVRRHLPRRESVEDMLQEVFLKMFTRLDQYQGGAPFTHWLSKIALRTCFDRLRAQRSRPELRHADLREDEVRRLSEAVIDPQWQSAGETLAGRDLLDQLLAGLNDADRRVITWFYLERKNTADISGLTGWTIPFAKMRIFRARRKLQRALARLRGWDRPSGLRPRQRPRRRLRRRRVLLDVSLQVRAA
jgi:RNA polymerase sigma factor (sigma-70 family)